MQFTQNEAENFMKEALIISRRAYPLCLPNPPVGCVLVRNKKIIAKGFTGIPGEMHAEASALSKLSEKLEDVTLFVTLEPCSFLGRTKACAKEIVKRELKNVYVSILDPDPRNNGAGIKILEDAGIDVDVGILAKEVSAFINPYLNK